MPDPLVKSDETIESRATVISSRLYPDAVSNNGASAKSAAMGAVEGNVGRKAVRNSASQAVGRLVVAALRLVIAAMIARQYGTVIFAEYSLLFGVMAIAEWILDFGTIDIFVREICRNPATTGRVLGTSGLAKLLQIPAAFAVLMAVLIGMQYGSDVVRAGLWGGLSLVFYAGVLNWRTAYQATLTMERDAAAELLAVVIMVPMIRMPIVHAAGLSGLAVAYTISRMAFFFFAWLFGRTRFSVQLPKAAWQEALSGLRASTAIGIAGFVIVLYEALDILLLSRFGGVGQVAFYSGAQRFVWPALTALAAVSATVYPIATSCWTHARERFDGACQRGLDLTLLAAGAAVTALAAGSDFLTGVLGHGLAAAAPVLRVLCILCFAKAISSTLGPLLYIVGRQREVLNVVVFATCVKAVAIMFAASRYGFFGVAVAAVASDLCSAVIPLVFLVRRHTGFKVKWGTPVRIVLAAGFCATAARMAVHNGLFSAVIGIFLYLGLSFFSGAVAIEDIQALFSRGVAATATVGREG